MVTIATAGMTPVFYLIALRIYVTTDVDAQWAQDTMDSLIQTIDARMDARFGPSQWETEFVPELAAFVATNVFEVGREDDAFS